MRMADALRSPMRSPASATSARVARSGRKVHVTGTHTRNNHGLRRVGGAPRRARGWMTPGQDRERACVSPRQSVIVGCGIVGIVAGHPQAALEVRLRMSSMLLLWYTHDGVTPPSQCRFVFHFESFRFSSSISSVSHVGHLNATIISLSMFVSHTDSHMDIHRRGRRGSLVVGGSPKKKRYTRR